MYIQYMFINVYGNMLQLKFIFYCGLIVNMSDMLYFIMFYFMGRVTAVIEDSLVLVLSRERINNASPLIALQELLGLNFTSYIHEL